MGSFKYEKIFSSNSVIHDNKKHPIKHTKGLSSYFKERTCYSSSMGLSYPFQDHYLKCIYK